ncbi:MAG: hypothetical protein NC548_25230 [Lachnospiraceae bacterium]|nr:hypothetical protein [Lachnospiraceae bacterium]
MEVMEVPHELLADGVWELLSVQGGTDHFSQEKLQELAKKVKAVRSNAIRRAFAVMMGDLYEFDIDSLEADIAKIALLDADNDVRAEASERVKLLRILWWIISIYFEGDISLAVRTCREINPLDK